MLRSTFSRELPPSVSGNPQPYRGSMISRQDRTGYTQPSIAPTHPLFPPVLRASVGNDFFLVASGSSSESSESEEMSASSTVCSAAVFFAAPLVVAFFVVVFFFAGFSSAFFFFGFSTVFFTFFFFFSSSAFSFSPSEEEDPESALALPFFSPFVSLSDSEPSSSLSSSSSSWSSSSEESTTSSSFDAELSLAFLSFFLDFLSLDPDLRFLPRLDLDCGTFFPSSCRIEQKKGRSTYSLKGIPGENRKIPGRNNVSITRHSEKEREKERERRWSNG